MSKKVGVYYYIGLAPALPGAPTLDLGVFWGGVRINNRLALCLCSCIVCFVTLLSDSTVHFIPCWVGGDSSAPRSSQRIPNQLVEIELAAEPCGTVTGFVLTLVTD